MKQLFISLLSLILTMQNCFAQFIVTDIFNRNLSGQNIILTDWEGYMANPAIKLNISPPAGAVFPLTVNLSANNSRLYFDMPSSAGASGPSKSITFANSSPKNFYISIFPDRDTLHETYSLSLNSVYGLQTFSIKVTDQDINPPSEGFKVSIDYSQDNQYQFFASAAKKSIVQQAADDWSYFIADMNFDSIAAGIQPVYIWTDNYASGNFAYNASKYKGYYLFAYGLHVNPDISGGSPSNINFQTVGGGATPLRRAGAYNADPHGNYNTLGWDTTISDSTWYLATNLGNVSNDLYSIAHHEIGHALNFNPAFTNFATYKAQGYVNTADVVNYQGSTIPIDNVDHLSGAGGVLQTDRISKKGLFGSEYANVMPYGRWLPTKADLLVFKAIGYTIKNTSAFTVPAILTNSIPNGTTGIAYNQLVTASGGIPFYKYDIIAGVLPNGLSLNSFTGLISGTPTLGGAFNFTVRVTDYDNKTAQKVLSITISIDCATITAANCAKPTGLTTSNITSTSAKIRWGAVTCAVGYQYEWRKKGTIPWITGQTTGISKTLTGLTANTTYQWRVITACRISPDTITSAGYTTGPEFTTLTFAAIANNNADNLKTAKSLQAILFPNPTKDMATVSISNAVGKVRVILSDISGKQVWQGNAPALKGEGNTVKISIPIQSLAAGTYMLQVKDEKETVVVKMVKE